MTIDELTEASRAADTHRILLARAFGDSTEAPAHAVQQALVWAIHAHMLMSESYRLAEASGRGDPARMARLRELLGEE